MTWRVWLLCLATAAHVGADEGADYARQVKPLLAERCYSCHGALKQEANLRLDTAGGMRQGGDAGAAIEPGKSDASLLLARVRESDPDSRMPPHDVGTALSADQIEMLARWIDSGASAPPDETPEADPGEHWAFRPPVRAEVPDASAAAANLIDAYLADKRHASKLSPQPRAERDVLLRRVTFDLIGLPPDLNAIQDFSNDERPDAFERVVDRLLASPAHAERWARHWMDIWRYSDWWGLGEDLRNSQKHIWHWRDWIIESLNKDVGYDEMLRQMLAADELYPTDLKRLRATGYLARQYFKFNRTTWMDETIEHSAKAFLGLTMNCAKCHDHKYDPVTQQDYYRFRAFFEPYQVRTDQVPGEVRFEKDGVPRAFDCNLEAPTYLFTRGDEKMPVKDAPLGPGLPSILTQHVGPLTITPVALPVEAHSPGQRPYVLGDHMRAAEERIAQARAEHDASKQLVEAIQKSDASSTAALVTEMFKEDSLASWDIASGNWERQDGGWRQSQVGETSARLRGRFEVPADFQATMRFVVHGGNHWKSAGLSFDVAEKSDVFFYLSAVEGGSKLQVGYLRDGQQVYPPEAQVTRPVVLGEAQEITVQVRGKLINVFHGEELELAWTLPVDRVAGRIELWTFDAIVEFQSFELRGLPGLALPSSLVSTPLAAASVELANKGLELARNRLALHAAEPAVLVARSQADRAKAMTPPDAQADALAMAAAHAEKAQALRRAEIELAAADLEQRTTVRSKREEAAKRVTAAKDALAKAIGRMETQDAAYAPLAGAQKAMESNVEDEASRTKPFPKTSSGRRRALAQWMTDKRNPLTARVMVNHIWARHFGRAIVETIFDFGRKGSPPTHPELLDALAVEMIDHDWEMKYLHRLMVTSDAYQMTSSEAGASEEARRVDPDNKLYWRMNPVRMESQVVRDALLTLSDGLDRAVGGPSIPLAADSTTARRSLYFVHSHNDQHRFLTVFDDANVLQCYRRTESIVPQQALALANSRQALEAADRIAGTMSLDLNDADFVRVAFEKILGTSPSQEELSACMSALVEFRMALTDAPEDVSKRRARAGVVHALLNHNDFITIR